MSTFSQIDKAEFKTDYRQLTNQEMALKYGAHLRTIQNWARRMGLSPKLAFLEKIFATFVEASQIKSSAELAKQFNIPVTTVVDEKARLREQGNAVGYGRFPVSETVDYTQAIIRVKSDNFIVLGDCEIPDHDAELLEAAADIGEKYGIKDLVLNGDIVAVDWLSDWFKTFAVPATLDMELGPFERIIGEYCNRFERVFENEGNHERRLPHKVMGNISIHHLLQHRFKNLQWTRYSYIYVASCGPNGKGDDQTWLVCHQDNYSKVPFSVPLELCSINLCHVIAAHNHRLGKVRHKSGKFWAIEGGFCRDVNRTLYKVARKNRHPNWTAGFVMVLDGIPHCIDKDNYRQFLRGTIDTGK